MKFSFIIPVFNAGKYIKKCLKSILNQSMDDFEIICIDDSSTDNSLEILKNFSQMDDRIVVHSNKKNKGAGISRNIGLNYATGEYIAFVDADDWIEKDFCETLYNNAKTNDSDIVLFNSIEYNLDDTSRKRIYFPKNEVNENEVFNYNYDKNLILNRFFVIWSKIYKREFIEKIKFNDLRIFEDIPFHVESMITAKRISYVPKELYNYRKLNENSEQNFKVKTENAFTLFEIFNIVEDILIQYNSFENLKENFIKFKILESKNVFDKLELMHKQKAYSVIKKEFKKINPFDIPEIDQNYKNFYSIIYNSSDFTEFNILNNLATVETNVDNKLLKNQKLIKSIQNDNNKMQKIIDENQKTIHTLTHENKELYELNQHYERRIDELKQQCDNNKNTVQQINKDKSKAQESLNQLKNENQQLINEKTR